MQEPIIEVKNVSFYYPPLEVLEDVNLTVKKGEFLAIIGPNGGGKTTLLKIILGLLKPQKGEVYIGGKRVEELGKWRSKIGYVPQTAQIDYTFPITVEEFVMTGRFGLIGLGKRPQAHDWEMVRKALREVKMEEWSKKQIGELSGGQRQKILIARSLALEPEILILDEPTTAVDPESSESFYELLLRLHEQGITIITVSHDVGVVAQYVDSIACLNRRLIKHDRPEEVIREGVLEEMYGREAAFFHHGAIPHIVVRETPPER